MENKPIVDAEFEANVPFSYLVARQVLPTPDSPKNTTTIKRINKTIKRMEFRLKTLMFRRFTRENYTNKLPLNANFSALA